MTLCRDSIRLHFWLTHNGWIVVHHILFSVHCWGVCRFNGFYLTGDCWSCQPLSIKFSYIHCTVHLLTPRSSVWHTRIWSASKCKQLQSFESHREWRDVMTDDCLLQACIWLTCKHRFLSGGSLASIAAEGPPAFYLLISWWCYLNMGGSRVHYASLNGGNSEVLSPAVCTHMSWIATILIDYWEKVRCNHCMVVVAAGSL